jgi:hypothetical protein
MVAAIRNVSRLVLSQRNVFVTKKDINCQKTRRHVKKYILVIVRRRSVESKRNVKR